MSAAAADIERNPIHVDIKNRVDRVLAASEIPLAISLIAQRARCTTRQARRVADQLVADGRARKDDNPRFDNGAYAHLP